MPPGAGEQLSQKALRRDRHVASEDLLARSLQGDRMTDLSVSGRGLPPLPCCELVVGTAVRTQTGECCHTGPYLPTVGGRPLVAQTPEVIRNLCESPEISRAAPF